MRLFGTVLVMFAAATALVAGQQDSEFRDVWQTKESCLSAPDATAPFYRPSITSRERVADNEVKRGHPTGGCVRMHLPDRLGVIAWVRVEKGREFIFEKLADGGVGRVLRLAECNNEVYEIAPFPERTSAAPAPGPPTNIRIESGGIDHNVKGEVELRLPQKIEVELSKKPDPEPERRVVERTWFERHWKPIVLGTVGTAAVICSLRCRVTQTVNVIVD